MLSKKVLTNFFVDWRNFDTRAKEIYAHKLCNPLSDISICTDVSCKANHSSDIDDIYNILIDSIREASSEFTMIKKVKFKPVPGWNDHCREKYRDARIAFLKWIECGRIRSGALFENMKVTRSLFVRALNWCKRNERRIRSEKLAIYLRNKNVNQFWKEVRSNRCSDKIDGMSNDYDIARVFREKFSAISGHNDSPERQYGDITDPATLAVEQLFSNSQISVAINKIKTGIGVDGVHSNHLKYLPANLIKIVTQFFNACIIHNHLPIVMLNGYINPRLKDKNGDLNSSDNYREIMISNNMFKVFEYVLLDRIKSVIALNDSQFGYREGTSTLMAVALFKETISKYISEGSTVYTSFLDLSKAFERVNHRKLLVKLKNLNVPPYILKILLVLFRNSQVSVKYGEIFSDKWNLERGVRQGGILSAFLFCAYLDDILGSMKKCIHGCKLGINLINCIAYADDVVLMAPTATGFQHLLNHVGNKLIEANLVINVRKTVCMVFRPNSRVVNSRLNFVVDNRNVDIVNQIKYLGCIFSDDFNDMLDINRCFKSFNKSAGFLLRKFFYASSEVKYSLFNSFCSSMYGCELWTRRKKCSLSLKEFGVSYHAALKKILSVPKFFSNHFVCMQLNTVTFNHLINFRMARFLHSLKNSSSSCLFKHKFYFTENSFLKSFVFSTWQNIYDVDNILENDLDALMSRILYVQIREPSSMYILNAE